MNRNAMLGFKWDYGHQNYIDDLKRKEMYKAELMQGVKQCKLSFLKRRKVVKLVNTLQKLSYLLDEPIQTSMMLNEEVWSCDCLEYRIDFVYDYISKMSIKPQKVSVEEIYPLCQVEMDIDISYVEMTEALRKSKNTNPIIILVNEMFVKPFVINGNHRIRNAYITGIKEIELYIINSDDVVDCLISEDYIKAYAIYKKLNALMGLQLMC